jgi:transcriptional regulator with XRE-family HTH domain
MKKSKELLGSRVRELRKNAGLSQDQLSEQIGIDAKHLSRIELGKSYPYIETLEAIARVFDVDLMDLFDFSHLKNSHITVEDIEQMLHGLSGEKLRLIYKIVKSISR